ncbi:hypothetical protein M758_UG301600 [Ceratodon purpureus]|nr:hypothetical protein M758_UG301600 [Ceratodon purpureus]
MRHTTSTGARVFSIHPGQWRFPSVTRDSAICHWRASLPRSSDTCASVSPVQGTRRFGSMHGVKFLHAQTYGWRSRSVRRGTPARFSNFTMMRGVNCRYPFRICRCLPVYSCRRPWASPGSSFVVSINVCLVESFRVGCICVLSGICI